MLTSYNICDNMCSSQKDERRSKMDINMLLSKMKLYGDTQKTLSDFLDITEQTFIRKKKDGNFSQPEIKAIIKRYDLTDEEIVKIFF